MRLKIVSTFLLASVLIISNQSFAEEDLTPADLQAAEEALHGATPPSYVPPGENIKSPLGVAAAAGAVIGGVIGGCVACKSACENKGFTQVDHCTRAGNGSKVTCTCKD